MIDLTCRTTTVSVSLDAFLEMEQRCKRLISLEKAYGALKARLEDREKSLQVAYKLYDLLAQENDVLRKQLKETAE